LTPSSLATCYSGPSPLSYKFAKDKNDQVGVARAYLEKTLKKMKEGANKKRCSRELKVRDLVPVKMYDHIRCWENSSFKIYKPQVQGTLLST